MRLKVTFCAILLVIFAGGLAAQAQDTEQDIVNRYLQKAEKQHVRKTVWASVGYAYNRINRNNDYNSFADYENQSFGSEELDWLNNANTFSVEFGTLVKSRLAWSLGGEYWMEFGQKLDGSKTYTPSLGTAVEVTDPESKIKVWGVYTGMQYYLLNPPVKGEQLKGLALRAGGSIGYYGVSWDLWQDYQNLNLSTSLPESENITFKDSAPGLTVDFGADYPIGLFNMVLATNVNYLYLNFNNVAWYNSQDEEIIASFNGTDEGRVDLGLSGFRARVELKKFFSW